MTAERHRKRPGQIPEHDAKGRQRCQLLQKSNQKLQSQRNELIDILTDSLVRVIRIAL